MGDGGFTYQSGTWREHASVDACSQLKPGTIGTPAVI